MTVIASDADKLLYNRMIEIMDNQLYGFYTISVIITVKINDGVRKRLVILSIVCNLITKCSF